MNISKRIFTTLASVCLSTTLLSSPASADEKGGFSLGSTRVIYNAEQKEATITVVNSAKNSPFLAQTWVSNYEGSQASSKAPFIVTPPLYRQDQGKNTLRIVRNGGNVATDRESVFWLNVKAVPAQSRDSQGKNTLAFAYVLKIKLFYRPDNLPSTPGEAYKQLSFSRSGNVLTAHNPTPYYVTLNKAALGGAAIKDVTAMVPPLGQQSYTLPAGASGQAVTYRTLNDMGGVMPEESKVLTK